MRSCTASQFEAWMRHVVQPMMRAISVTDWETNSYDGLHLVLRDQLFRHYDDVGVCWKFAKEQKSQESLDRLKECLVLWSSKQADRLGLPCAFP